MNSKRTLVILTPGFPSSESDSTCLPMQQCFVRTVQRLYPELEIRILTFQYPYHRTAYTWHGIHVIPFGGKNRGGLTKLRVRNQTYSTLRAVQRTRQMIGLLSFWTHECAWIGKKFGDRNGVNHYEWVLGQDARKENKYPSQVKFRPEELIALSDFLQDEFHRNHGVKPALVIPPGVDEGLFHPVGEKDIDVLGAGSLIHLKQYPVFIQVIATMKQHVPAIKTALVGSGPEMKNLQLLASRLDVQDSIEMPGELSYPQTIAIMERAKVFLHPSSYEGFSGACLEALRAGAYVISFCQPMKKEIKNWHVVKDAAEMADTALRMLRNPQPSHDDLSPFSMDDAANSIVSLFLS